MNLHTPIHTLFIWFWSLTISVTVFARIEAIPRSTFAINLPTGEFSANIPSGIQLPVVFDSEKRVYFQVDPEESVQCLVSLSKSDLERFSGAIENGRIRFNVPFEQNFHTVHFLFEEGSRYEVADRNGKNLKFVLSTSIGQRAIQLEDRYFSISLASASIEDPLSDISSPDSSVSDTDFVTLRTTHAQRHFIKAATADQCAVHVRSDNSAGTGFVLHEGNNNFVYTNQHVIGDSLHLTLTTSEGIQLTPVAVQVARDSDLARFLITENVPALNRIRAPMLNEKIFVYGDSYGAGRITFLAGKVTGLNPQEVEVDAEFVPGNSGSAIMGSDSSVLGVATYLESVKDPEEISVRDTQFTKARRVGIRLDRDIEWITIDQERFYRMNQRFFECSDFLREGILTVAMIYRNLDSPISEEFVENTRLRHWVTSHNANLTFLHDNLSKLDAIRKISIRREKHAALYQTFVENQVKAHSQFIRTCLNYEFALKTMRPYPGTEHQRASIQDLKDDFEALSILNKLLEERIQSNW